jgi:hypothetical protein
MVMNSFLFLFYFCWCHVLICSVYDFVCFCGIEATDTQVCGAEPTKIEGVSQEDMPKGI